MVRLISLQVLLFTGLLLYTKQNFFAYVLFFDFIFRALQLKKYSLFYTIANFIIKTFKVKPKLCDEAPKRFAVYLGVFLTFLLVITYTLGLEQVATVMAIVLLLCSFLETVFDFCVGCKIYYVIQLSKGFFSK